MNKPKLELINSIDVQWIIDEYQKGKELGKIAVEGSRRVVSKLDVGCTGKLIDNKDGDIMVVKRGADTDSKFFVFHFTLPIKEEPEIDYKAKYEGLHEEHLELIKRFTPNLFRQP